LRHCKVATATLTTTLLAPSMQLKSHHRHRTARWRLGLRIGTDEVVPSLFSPRTSHLTCLENALCTASSAGVALSQLSKKKRLPTPKNVSEGTADQRDEHFDATSLYRFAIYPRLCHCTPPTRRLICSEVLPPARSMFFAKRGVAPGGGMCDLLAQHSALSRVNALCTVQCVVRTARRHRDCL